VEDKILIDAFGGDNSPAEIVKGAAFAAQNFDITLVLVGKKDAICTELEKYQFPENRIEILNATEIIDVDEVPTVAIKRKKDSSVVVGLNALKEGKGRAFISAGSTGAVLAGATLLVGRIPGVLRPALATFLPVENGFSLILDVGANVDPKPEYLAQFALMGSVYSDNMTGVVNPRVGLINIGAEKEKGTSLTKEAYKLIEETPEINFAGNIEARDIPFGKAEVLVCDAFTGNVILKYTEGLSQALLERIKKEMTAGVSRKIGAALLAPAFASLKKGFDYKEIGGAPLLGLEGLVVKAHGSSDSKAVASAIKQCIAFIEKDIVYKIKKKL